MKKSKMTRLLHETCGIDLSDEDKFYIEGIQLKLNESRDLEKVMTSTTALGKMKIKFDRAVDDLLLDFLGSKLDLYIKLTEPKVNMIFKSEWFEKYRKKIAFA
jgi:type I restriction enzyme, R subunit